MECDELFREVAKGDGVKKGYYAHDDAGKYVLETKIPWGEEVVEGLYMLEARAHLEEVRKMVLAGQRSSLFYHMERQSMTPGLLGKTSGIATFRVKRHLRPEIFVKLKPSLLERYAEALATTVEELKTVPNN